MQRPRMGARKRVELGCAKTWSLKKEASTIAASVWRTAPRNSSQLITPSLLLSICVVASLVAQSTISHSKVLDTGLGACAVSLP